MIAKGWTLAGAESCTGGLIGHIITNNSGSSAYFWGGIMSYAYEVKESAVGVPHEMLMAHGAVSEPVALAMARGVRDRLGVDVGYSVTGIAGPLGGTPTKPVGTTYMAVVTPDSERVEHHLWADDRKGNKMLSAQAVLDLLMTMCA